MPSSVFRCISVFQVYFGVYTDPFDESTVLQCECLHCSSRVVTQVNGPMCHVTHCL